MNESPRIEIPTGQPCYFMVADILGFSALVSNLEHAVQTQRIYEWVRLIRDTAEEVGITDWQLISDTLFVREHDSSTGLARLLKFGREVLERGMSLSIPIRGGIVHGTVSWGTLTYGSAVVEAHNLERSLQWIGIACDSGIPRIDDLWNWDVVSVYPVPKKFGQVLLQGAICWRVPPGKQFTMSVTGRGLMQSGEALSWELLGKLEQTLAFDNYVRTCKEQNLSPSVFHSAELPIFETLLQ